MFEIAQKKNNETEKKAEFIARSYLSISLLTPVCEAPESEWMLPVGEAGGSNSAEITGFLSTCFSEVSSGVALSLVAENRFPFFSSACPLTPVRVSDFPLSASCSFEVSESFEALLDEVSMVTFVVIPPDVVMATVGVTVTTAAVVGCELSWVVLFAVEPDSFAIIDAESFVVTGSNCITKQDQMIIDIVFLIRICKHFLILRNKFMKMAF